MATIKQINKQIETASKRISNFEKRIAMYYDRCNKAISALNKLGANITIDNIKIAITYHGTYPLHNYSLDSSIREQYGWEMAYKVESNFEEAKTNERRLSAEFSTLVEPHTRYIVTAKQFKS